MGGLDLGGEVARCEFLWEKDFALEGAGDVGDGSLFHVGSVETEGGVAEDDSPEAAGFGTLGVPRVSSFEILPLHDCELYIYGGSSAPSNTRKEPNDGTHADNPGHVRHNAVFFF